MGSFSGAAGLATIAGFSVGLAVPVATRYAVQGNAEEGTWQSRLAGNLGSGAVIGASLIGMTHAKNEFVGLGSVAAMFGAMTSASLLGIGDIF